MNGSEKGGISAPMGGLSRGLLVFLSSVGLLQPLVPCPVSDFRKMKAAKTDKYKKSKGKGGLKGAAVSAHCVTNGFLSSFSWCK